MMVEGIGNDMLFAHKKISLKQSKTAANSSFYMHNFGKKTIACLKPTFFTGK